MNKILRALPVSLVCLLLFQILSQFSPLFDPATVNAVSQNSPIIINHTSTNLSKIPEEWINKAKSSLKIAYGHTSHGSQIVSGMSVIADKLGKAYSFNNGGTNGALDFRDTPFSGASDLGNPDRTQWASATRQYLDRNPDINVIIWSWCGQVSSASEANINTYLNLMSQLETDYPNVSFVYMTGHTDGSGINGQLHLRNNQIREYCKSNNKILYDFEEIESYDPDGNYYGDKNVNDECNYDSDKNGTLDSNWAINWQNSHTEGVEWFRCSSAHSQPLNANLKGYAAWHLWAMLAGWQGQNISEPSNSPKATPTATITPIPAATPTSTKPTTNPSPTVTPTPTKPATTPSPTVTPTPPTKPATTPSPTITPTPTTKPVTSPSTTLTPTPTTKPVTSPSTTLTTTPTTKPATTPSPTFTPTPTTKPAISSSPLQTPNGTKTLRLENTDVVDDTFIYSSTPDLNTGSTPYVDSFQRFIIKFKLPDELKNAKIIDAKIYFYVWNQKNWQPNQNMKLYKLRGNFDENTATWNLSKTNSLWTNPGGDFNVEECIAIIPHLEGSTNWDHVFYPPVDITNTVESWVASPDQNNGLLLINDGVTSIGLKASEYSSGKRPYLLITYGDKQVSPTPSTSPIIDPVIAGDVNGDKKVDSTDLAFYKRYILGLIDKFPVSDDMKAADLNLDGKINSTDQAILKRYLLGIIISLPIK